MCIHKDGRIWMVWNPVVHIVTIKGANDLLSHSLVDDKVTGTNFHETMIYSFNDQDLRRTLCTNIMSISGKNSRPWVVLNVFNYVLKKKERIGRPVAMAKISVFKLCVGQCGLHDIRST